MSQERHRTCSKWNSGFATPVNSLYNEAPSGTRLQRRGNISSVTSTANSGTSAIASPATTGYLTSLRGNVNGNRVNIKTSRLEMLTFRKCNKNSGASIEYSCCPKSQVHMWSLKSDDTEPAQMKFWLCHINQFSLRLTYTPDPLPVRPRSRNQAQKSMQISSATSTANLGTHTIASSAAGGY